jgi:hypothetical protein
VKTGRPRIHRVNMTNAIHTGINSSPLVASQNKMSAMFIFALG